MGIDPNSISIRQDLFGGVGRVAVATILRDSEPFVITLWCALDARSSVGPHRQAEYPEQIICVGGSGEITIDGVKSPFSVADAYHVPLDYKHINVAFGLGAMSGPFLCSIFMDLVGSNGFFVFLFFFHIVIGFFGIYRMKVRKTVDNPDSQFVAMPQTITPAGIELNPTTEHIEEPYSDKVKEILERKGVKYKKEEIKNKQI